MKHLPFFRLFFVRAVLFSCLAFAAMGKQSPAVSSDPGAPHLQRVGITMELMVDGKPFLMLAAELHNSSSSSLAYMQPIWPKLAAIPLNTVLTPLSWELLEPKEGTFDFALVDGLIDQARKNNLHIVFLWLGSWKNGMSSYAPVWVKEDTQRFPRVIERGDQPVEILSPLGSATMQADAKAFAALMHHIRQVDADKHTVLMMQVENEVGVLGDSRDRSALADKAFAAPVPPQVFSYLQKHQDGLNPDFRELWTTNGSKTSGSWEQVFGAGARTDQLFMAWNYGRFIQHVAAAGKTEYPLPMYVNTWLGEVTALPGTFPSGGPLPPVVDMWKAAGSALDIFSPDIYKPDFAGWCQRYHRDGNPLFIPEARGGTEGQENVFYAVGQEGALGFSPFGIDSWSRDPNDDLGKSYAVLQQMAAVILSHEGKGEMTGFVLTRDNPEVFANLNGYQLDIRLDAVFNTAAQRGYGLVIADGPNKFIGAGAGFRVSFIPLTAGQPLAGIGAIEEGTFTGDQWHAGRRLNGDENDQGKFWRFARDAARIETADVYRYK
jgi:beta-galactosidase GanA